MTDFRWTSATSWRCQCLCVLAALAALQSSAFGQLVINELMPAPKAPEPEWVELLNIGLTDVTVENLYLHDSGSRALIPTVIVAAGQYVVLCKDTSALLAVRNVPRSAILVKMSVPSLNNTSEPLYLVRKDSVVLDSLYYDTKWGVNGRSLERRDPRMPALSSDNLSACTFSSGASCGALNSLSPLATDLSIEPMSIDSSVGRVTIVVRNVGTTTCSTATLRVQFAEVEELSMDLPHLAPALTFETSWTIDALRVLVGRPGEILVKAHVETASDMRPENDTLTTILFISPPAQSLLINEILFDPADGTSEFIELFNSSADEVDLHHLQLSDASGARLMIHQSVLVSGHGYAVIAHDSSIFKLFPRLAGNATLYVEASSLSLNSTDDLVALRDCYGRSLDSVHYESSWHSPAVAVTKGRSLEKRGAYLQSASRASWTSCTDSAGATPGRTNSVARMISDVGEVRADPNPFSPRSILGSRQSTVLSFRIPFAQARVNATIYDVNGMRVRTIANDEYSGSTGVLSWDGRNEQGFALMCGVYVLLLEAIDLNSAEIYVEKLVLVIGE